MQIFIAKSDNQTGPFSEEQIHSMLKSGMINRNDLAWHEGLSSWLPLHQILNVSQPLPPPLPKAHLQEHAEEETELGYDANSIESISRNLNAALQPSPEPRKWPWILGLTGIFIVAAVTFFANSGVRQAPAELPKPSRPTSTIQATDLSLAAPSPKLATVSVGGKSIILPPPEGFFRYDGKLASVDKMEQSVVPEGSRLLGSYGSEVDLADVLRGHLPKLERHFFASSDSSLELNVATLSYFQAFKPGVRQMVAMEPTQFYRDIVNDVENRIRYTGILVNVKIGDLVQLGIFDDTENSLCFSALSKVQVLKPSESDVTIGAICYIRVKERLFTLTVTAQYHGKADIEWARRSIQKWRDAILKANSP